jgi:DNA-binding transcriptional MerR regulator
MHRRLTIGEVARRTGVPVKTLRFYSDEGLLPPADRTASGYRLYDEDDLARLARIRTLRDVGLDLATIGSVLAGTMSLDQALRRRLRMVETEIVALRQVAAALRATLRATPGQTDPPDAPDAPDAPDMKDLERLCAVTRLTGEARRSVIEGFFEDVTAGVPVDRDWMQQMIDISVPLLPDEPSREQLDAWIELCELLSDQDFVARLRSHAAEVWTADFDLASSRRAIDEATGAARAAIDRGLGPTAPEAAVIVERFVDAYAAALGRPPDRAFRDWLVAHYRDRDPRTVRYGELLAVLRGQPAQAGPSEEWSWLIEASRAHLER